MKEHTDNLTATLILLTIAVLSYNYINKGTNITKNNTKSVVNGKT